MKVDPSESWMSWVKVYGLLGRGMNVAFRVCVRTGEERLWMDVVDGRRGEDERSVEGTGSFPIMGGIFYLFVERLNRLSRWFN